MTRKILFAMMLLGLDSPAHRRITRWLAHMR